MSTIIVFRMFAFLIRINDYLNLNCIKVGSVNKQTVQPHYKLKGRYDLF